MVYTNSRTNCNRKGSANYSREFKQRLVDAVNQFEVSVSKLAQEQCKSFKQMTTRCQNRSLCVISHRTGAVPFIHRAHPHRRLPDSQTVDKGLRIVFPALWFAKLGERCLGENETSAQMLLVQPSTQSQGANCVASA